MSSWERCFPVLNSLSFYSPESGIRPVAQPALEELQEAHLPMEKEIHPVSDAVVLHSVPPRCGGMPTQPSNKCRRSLSGW